jgi:uncharacterized protein YdhG (YjbR/CyaY superfamily)
MAMTMKNSLAENIDEYISDFPKDVQRMLKEMRSIIRKVAPKAEEAIRYAMPTFRLNDRNLVHFAAYKNHIGFYPTPGGIQAFKKELAAYKGSKGAVQFPIGDPLPRALIGSIVKLRVKESMEKVKAKKSGPRT